MNYYVYFFKTDEEEDSEGSLKDFIDDNEDDDDDSDSSKSSNGSDSDVSIKSNDKKNPKTRVTRAAAAAVPGGIDEIIKNQEEESKPVEWWEQFLSEEDLENINLSSKLFLLFEILAQCETIGDKMYIFLNNFYRSNY